MYLKRTFTSLIAPAFRRTDSGFRRNDDKRDKPRGMNPE